VLAPLQLKRVAVVEESQLETALLFANARRDRARLRRDVPPGCVLMTPGNENKHVPRVPTSEQLQTDQDFLGVRFSPAPGGRDVLVESTRGDEAGLDRVVMWIESGSWSVN
jgi:hypothetical protein